VDSCFAGELLDDKRCLLVVRSTEDVEVRLDVLEPVLYWDSWRFFKAEA